MPHQSITAMKVTFGVRAQYVTIAALSLFMVTQVIGVVIFSGNTQAVSLPAVTTGDAYVPDQTTATLYLQSSDISGISGATYGFEYGINTSYGSSSVAGSSQVRDSNGTPSVSTTGWSGRLRTGVYGGVRDGDGNFYTPAWEDDDSACRVMKFSAAGEFILQLGGACSVNSPTALHYVRGAITIDSGNNVYVGQYDSQYILKYAANGDLLQSIDMNQNDGSSSLAIDKTSGDLYVMTQDSKRILKFDSSGNQVSGWGVTALGSRNFGNPDSPIAVNSVGDIYVRCGSDPTSYYDPQTAPPCKKIWRYDSTGSLLGEWSVGPTGIGMPIIFIDDNDVVYAHGYGGYGGYQEEIYAYDKLGNALSNFDYTYFQMSNTNGITGVNTITGSIETVIRASDIEFGSFVRKGSSSLTSLTCGTTYHYRATSTVGGSTTYGADQQFTTNACYNSFAITTDSLTDGITGAPYSQTISTNSSNSVNFWITSGGLPPGLTLDSSGGISGTPTTPGTYQVDIAAGDGSANDNQEYFITISAGPQLHITTTSLSDAYSGTPYSESVESDDARGTPTYSLATGSLPDGLTLNASTGEISGTTSALTTTNFQFTVQVTDDTSSATQDLAITVNQAYQITVCSGGESRELRLKLRYESSVCTNYGMGYKTFSIVDGSLPPGISLDPISGDISGTPTTSGDFTAVIQVSDLTGVDYGQYHYTVPPSAGPLINTPIVTITSPASNTIYDYKHDSVIVTGTGPANRIMTFYMDGQLLGTTTVSSSGVWQYTVRNIFPGNHSFDAKWIPDKDVAYVPRFLGLVGGALLTEVDVLDLATKGKITTIHLPEGVFGRWATLNSAGTKLYISGADIYSQGTLIIEIDTATGTISNQQLFPIDNGLPIGPLVISSDDQFAYAEYIGVLSDNLTGGVAIAKIRLSDLTAVQQVPAELGSLPENIEDFISFGRTVLYGDILFGPAFETIEGGGDVARIVETTDNSVSNLQLNSDARWLGFFSRVALAGNSVYYTSNNRLIQVDPVSKTITHQIVLPDIIQPEPDAESSGISSLVVNATTHKAYLSYGSYLYSVDLQTDQVQKKDLLEDYPEYNTSLVGAPGYVSDMSISDNGQQLSVVNIFGGIQIIDPTSLEEVGSINFPYPEPRGVSFGISNNFANKVVAASANINFTIGEGPVVVTPIKRSPESSGGVDPLTATQVTPRAKAVITPFRTQQNAPTPQNSLFALVRRIPIPIAVGFPWFLLLIALGLVSTQYYQVRSESTATKRMQASVANQERLVDEQNNFVALTTHYIHTPLTVMEGEISLMVRAGTLTQAQATKLNATLTSLNAEAEAILAEEENV